MASRPSEDHDEVVVPYRPMSAKVVISGGFGVGKTTLVATASEIEPLRTEAAMTAFGESVDDRRAVKHKTTTTVAMDFGKLTLDPDLVLYLFGTPGQDRFGFMWSDITRGALGALVLVDTRRLEDCFPSMDFFEERDVPFIVAVNQFDGAPSHDLAEVREALDLEASTPLVRLDARHEPSVNHALLTLLGHILDRLETKVASMVDAS